MSSISNNLISFKNRQQETVSVGGANSASSVTTNNLERAQEADSITTSVNQKTIKKEASTAKKWGVGIGSLLIPGLGQAINGDWGKAIGFFGGTVILTVLAGSFGPFALLALGLRGWSVFDAVKNAASKDAKKDDKILKPGFGAILGGILAGSFVSGIPGHVHNRLIAPNILKNMHGISNNISKKELTSVKTAINDTMSQSKLKDKGIELITASKENKAEIKKLMADELDNGLITKHFPAFVKKFYTTVLSGMFVNGNNAAYIFKNKKIIMPEKKLALAFFHEAGHAMNANLSTLGKTLQKCRALSILSLPIAAIGLFKTKKAEGEEPNSSADKATTFIKNNAGKLTFATFLPIIIEEAMATAKGNKFAKDLLNEELAKKVVKTNRLGLLSYISLAGFAGLGTYLGVKVKDSIAHRRWNPDYIEKPQIANKQA